MPYQIRSTRGFCAAHALKLYDGSMEPIHGHNWRVQVTVQAEKLDAIGVVMRDSVRELFPRYYDARQTSSAEVHIAHVDRMLIDDGTYFVHEVDGQIVACGGWSRRGRLYTGGGDHEGDDRLLDATIEAAHIRAMFVRRDWTRRGLGQIRRRASARA